jgi:hypothetical protein
MDRRDALRVVGGVSIAGLAGCSVLGGDSGSEGPLFRESFEADGLPETMTDESQSEADVALASDLASDGSQSLGMGSTPGTSTSANVTTAESFSGARRYAVDLYKVVDDVSEGGCRFSVLDRDSDARLDVFDIDYYGGSCYEEVDENGDTVTTSSFGQPLPTGQWHTLSMEVGGDAIGFSIGGQKTNYEPSLSWTDRDVVVRLNANVWGGAFGQLDVRYDNLHVSDR